MANMQRGGYMGRFRGRGESSENDRKFIYRFLIPSKAAIIIMGKGCERIHRLSIECNSRLSIPDNKGPERVFVIDGSYENCVKIWSECFPDLKDVMGVNNGEEMDLRFLCHNSIVGAVIGKGGTRVKELRTTYQLSVIKVHVNVAPRSTDRVVQIVGAPDKLFGCLKVMFSELESQNLRGPVENYNPDNYDELMAPEYGGWKGEPGWQYMNQGDGAPSYSQPPVGYGTDATSDPYGRASFEAARTGPPPAAQAYDSARNGPPPISNPYEATRSGPPPTNNPYDGGNRGPPPMGAYDGGRGPPAYDQATRNAGPAINPYGRGPMDPYEAARAGPPPSSDLYDMERGAPLPMSQFVSSRAMAGLPSTDDYDAAPQQYDHYQGTRPTGGPAGANQYGRPSADQYDDGSTAASAQYGGAPPSGGPYGGGQYGGAPTNDNGPRSNQYGYNRSGGPSYNDDYGQYGAATDDGQYGRSAGSFDGGAGAGAGGSMARGGGYGDRGGHRGGSRGGGGGYEGGQRKIVPLMGNCDYEADQSSYYKGPGNDDGRGYRGRGRGGAPRRPFNDDNRSSSSKKSRPWSTEDGDEDNDDNMTAATNHSGVLAGGPDVVNITIPSLYLGALRGAEGEKLSNIMKDSGADIVVSPVTTVASGGCGNDVTVLSVKGTKDQIEGAQYLMQMCMKRCMLNLTHG